LNVEGRKYQINKAFSDELGLSIVTFIPEETVKRPLSKFNLWAWLFSITSVVAIVIYSYSSYKFVHKPLLLLVQSFRRMEDGSLDIPIKHEKEDEFGYLYNRFNQMLLKLQTLIDQDYKQKLMMQKAELKQLQSQINPHFLYNSFFILNSLAKTGDIERVERFTNMLGEYFRFITRNGEDNVLLSEEIRHSRMYTEIQNLRFSRRIRVQFDDWPTEMERIRVPRLVVQPIIENAYEHSLEKMTEDGLLRVSFEMNQNEALVIVEDNGDISDTEIEAIKSRLASTAESYEMTGMINIHRRMQLTYGDGSGLFVSRSKLNGLKVVIRMKLPGEDWQGV
jgi:two-component system sensor histidine kinase YesM